jgi:methionyl-tRNA formyltransferase
VRLAFLAADDPIYLPDFFEGVLTEFASSTDTVYLVPPLYKGQTARAAAWRYYRTFGVAAVMSLVKRLIRVKVSRRSIERVCRRHGVRHAVAADVNAPEFVAELAHRDIDVIVSVSCPQIFKRDMLRTPTLGCLNVHGALLPRYRGIMPSYWMLANGEGEAGVTVYFMNEDIDAGDIAGQRKFEIRATDTLDQFLQRSKRVAAELVTDVLHQIEHGTVTRRPMDVSEGSYFSWPDRASVRRFLASGRRLW